MIGSIINIKLKIMKSEYIKLTELWQDGEFELVGKSIANSRWNHAELAEFCAYFNKYLGKSQLDVLYKFL